MRRAKKACLHLALATLCILSTLPMGAQVSPRLLCGTPVTYNQNGPRIRIFSEDVKETVKLFVISDTHLWMSDSREDPYRQYSERMAAAYHNNRHFLTGEPTTSREAFLRTLDAERRFAEAPRQSLQELKDGNCAMDRLTVAFGALLGATLVVGEIGVLGVAGALAARGAIPVGDVVVYQMLFLAAMQSVQGIVSLLPETAALREGVDSLNEILGHAPPRRGGRRIDAVESVEFRGVTFAYPGADAKPVVKDFSTSFRAGRIVALVGANGSGKTTLFRLATAALAPQAGEILVNGSPIAALNDGFFRRRLGIVFQDSLLVSGTVRDNITLRDPDFTASDIDEAMTLSGLKDVVGRLPDGLDTRVGLGGQSLSGGEMQRLAIARALVRRPGILVLDEVTNHLDAEARAGFGKLLRRLAPGRIVLVVSHDPAIIKLCDEKISCQIYK